MSVTVLKGFLSVSNMKIIYNFTLICTLFIIQFLNSRVKEVILKNCGTCVLIPQLPQLPRLPARQVRMEEEEGVEEEEEDLDNAEEEEEDLDHAEEETFDPDFGPLLGEILQVE